MLYHLTDPAAALADAPSAPAWRAGRCRRAEPPRLPGARRRAPRAPLTFDAELAPVLLAELFAEVEVERWDARLLELPI
jgi:hypothetical protein